MTDWLSEPWLVAAAILLGSFVAAVIVEFIFRHVFLAFAARTATTLDDQIVKSLRRPIYFAIVLTGIALAARAAPLQEPVVRIGDNVLATIAILVWSAGLAKVASLIFGTLATRAGEHSLIQPRTQPLFDIFSTLAFVAAGSYAILLAWNINIGAWMASAGIAGIALGFAAKDSLSNLFAGILIIADAPYKLGDFIVLDGQIRGAVTAIGFRSTRLLTLDDVEVIVPNSLIGNAQIVNESGGPYRKARVAVTVECAYGSDADQVKEVMLACAEGAPRVATDPQPMVRFSSFGASGLVHELLVWIELPRFRELVVDDLNRRLYKAFAAAKIEIPYSKHDLFIKQIEGLPSPLGTPPRKLEPVSKIP